MRIQSMIVCLAVILLIPACSPVRAASPAQPPKPPIAVTPTLKSLASGSAACFDLLTPENNVELPAIGRIDFTWQPLQDAARYVVEMKLPDGTTLPFKTSDTKLRRYAESTTMGGTYEWQVTAYGASGETLCTAGPLSYFKPELSKPQKNKPGSQSGCPAPQGCTNWDPVACVCNG